MAGTDVQAAWETAKRSGKWLRRFAIAAVLAALASLLVSGVAFADGWPWEQTTTGHVATG